MVPHNTQKVEEKEKKRRREKKGKRIKGERQGMKKVIHIVDFVVDSRYFRPDLSWGWW